ncbi:hypothetical protein [Thermogutta sp.]|uniref:hypothetical protein n=1 Tax=Thermogutta sp. TaxID=1962930 RepID=UPI0032208DC6
MTSRTKQESADPTIHLRRHALGVLAALLCLGAIFFHFRPPSNSFEIMCESACWRMAPVTALLWLAYYRILELPQWLVLAVPCFLIVVVLRPKLLLFAAPVILLILFLKPRPAKSAGKKQAARRR